MANVLVTYLYDVESEDEKVYEREVYLEMQQLCVSSYLAHLRDLDEVRILTGRATDFVEMYEIVFDYVMDVSTRGHDVLLVDIDTMCVREARIFGCYDAPMLFGLAGYDEGDRRLQKFAEILGCEPIPADEFYNAGVVYVPRYTPGRWMDRECDEWAYVQAVWNYLAREHGALTPRPEFNYMAPPGGSGVETAIGRDEARIVHFHASRDAVKALRGMRACQR